MKIFQKTFLYTLTLLIFIALLASWLIYTLMPSYYTRQKQQELTSLADQLVQQLESAKREDIAGLIGSCAVGGQANIFINIGEDRYAYITWGSVQKADGTAASLTVSASFTDMKNGDESINSCADDPVGTQSSETDNAADYMPFIDNITSLSQAIEVQRSFTIDGEPGTLIVSMTLAPVDEAAGVIISLLPVSVLMCMVIAVIFSLLYARTITRPIKAISGETHNMRLLKRDARCHVESRDEFGELAANINYLYENLLSTINSLEAELKNVTAAERARNDFLRAASHELKTPVTAISVIMDNMMLGVGKYKNHDEWLRKCRDLLDGLSDKLRNILDASRLEDISEPDVTQGIEAFCTEILEPYIIIARARNLDVYIDFSASFPVTAPPKLLGKALSNIFSNAVLYTSAGGKFSVYCKGRSLIIENECEPIPEDQLSRLYEPFYRPDISRSRETGGNGLGLYIVKTILRRLGLEYRFEPVTSPEGMRFTITF